MGVCGLSWKRQRERERASERASERERETESGSKRQCVCDREKLRERDRAREREREREMATVLQHQGHDTSRICTRPRSESVQVKDKNDWVDSNTWIVPIVSHRGSKLARTIESPGGGRSTPVREASASTSSSADTPTDR